MPTNINFDKKLGISKGTSISLPTSEGCPPAPAFVDTNSFEFDGTTSYFDGNGVVYSELDNQTKVTFSFWVKPTTSTFRTIFSIANGSATPGEAQVICFLDSSNRVRITFGATTNNLFSEVDSIQVGFWNHVFIAIDLAQGVPALEGRVYIDGIDKTDTVNLSSLTQFDASTGDIYIGDDALNYQGKFLGYINELAIWPGEDYRNSALDAFNLGLPNDLNNLPTNPIGQTPVAPNAWFRMGEVANYDGSQWVMRDVNNCYYLYSNGIAAAPAQPTTDIPLFDNKSFVFDGVNDYVQTSSTYSELDGQTKATFSMWIKPTSNTSSRTVFQIGDGSTSGVKGVCQLWMKEGNRIDFSIESGSYFGRADISSINYGSWNHILIAIDLDSTDEFKCYVNGSDATTLDNLGSRTSFLTAADPLYIGEFTTGQYAPFLGNIDEFAIWSGTDLRNDVATIYNGGVPNDLNNNGLTAPTTWYRMGEDSLYNSGPGLWSFPDNGTGGTSASSLTLPEAARVSDVPT